MKHLPGRPGRRPVELLVGTLVIAASVALLTTRFWVLAPVPAVALALIVLLGRRPAWGFLLFVALLPFDAYTSLSATYPQITVSKLLGAVLVLMIAVRILAGLDRPSRFKSALWPWLLALLAISLISTFLSEFPDVAANHTRRLLTAYLVFAMTCFYLDERSLEKALPVVLIGSVSLASLLSAAGWALDLPYFVATSLSGEGGQERATGPQTDPNFFASTIVFAMPVLLYLMLSSRRTGVRLLLALLAAVNVAALVITYSRAGAFIMLVVVLLFFALRLPRFRPHHLPILLMTAAVAVAALLALVPSSYWERQLNVTEVRTDESIARRLSYLEFGWEAFKENPLLGSGPGTFRPLYARSPYGPAFEKENQPLERAAHNAFIELAVGTGILGVTVFLLIFGTAVRDFLRARVAALSRGKGSADLWTAYGLALLSVLLFSLFLSNLYVEYLWVSLAISQIGSRDRTGD